MCYKIKKYNYLYYEIEELSFFLNYNAAQGYKLIKIFSGYFIFKKTKAQYSYFVMKTDKNIGNFNKIKKIYLDKYLYIGVNTSATELNLNVIKKNRKQIEILNFIITIYSLIFLGLNLHMLINMTYCESQPNKIIFILSCILYGNYYFFYLGETMDYFIWCKNSLTNYHRSHIKQIIFAFANKLEIICCILSITALMYLFFLGEVLVALFWLFLYLFEIILRYHNPAGFFSYLYCLGMGATICSIFL